MTVSRLGCVLLVSTLFVGCQSDKGGAMIDDDEPQQVQPASIKVNLPPPPSFRKDHPPATYADSSYSVYGLRENKKTVLNKSVRVKAFVLEVYECPECPRGKECKQCDKPHLWLSDRANGAKDKAMLVTGYPKKDPRTRKKTRFDVGSQYYFSGVFSTSSGTGFRATDGLLVYQDAQLVTQAE